MTLNKLLIRILLGMIVSAATGLLIHPLWGVLTSLIVACLIELFEWKILKKPFSPADITETWSGGIITTFIILVLKQAALA